MNQLQIKYLPISDLKPYEGNAKIHTEEQLQQIMASIQEFGMNDPIAVWHDNEIIEGHGRLIACQRLGIETVPVISLDGLTDEQRRAYMNVHNQLTMNTGFDLDILAAELGKIENIDMERFGFIMPDVDGANEAAEADDYAEPANLPSRTKRGEIWLLGRHRLMVGDSTNNENVQKLIRGGCVDLVVTDPPYNVDYSGKTKAAMKIKNDNLSNEQFIDFLTAAFRNMHDALKPGGAFYIWCASMKLDAFFAALANNEIEPRELLIWVKSNFALGHFDYHWRHEPCLYGWKAGKHYFTNSRTENTVIDDSPDIDHMSKADAIDLLRKIYEQTPTTAIYEKKPNADLLHPTMKPVPLFGYQITNSSRRGETVLDLFGGSGTAMIACEQIDRTCLMMEYDSHYADVILDRWEKFTGGHAERADD